MRAAIKSVEDEVKKSREEEIRNMAAHGEPNAFSVYQSITNFCAHQDNNAQEA
jgi:hypothetical protein